MDVQPDQAGAAAYNPLMGNAPLTNEAAIEEAQRRYFMDPLFHARVTLCVRALEADLHKGTGQRMTSEDRSLATLAASLGVLLAHVDPTTGTL